LGFGHKENHEESGNYEVKIALGICKSRNKFELGLVSSLHYSSSEEAESFERLEVQRRRTMKNRMVIITVVAAGYLLTCAAGFAQNATQSHSTDSETLSAATVEAHNVAPAPAAEAKYKTAAKTLPLAPVAKSDATTVPSLREAQVNPYQLLTYKETDESKMLGNSYPVAPTRIFGPGWGTNIDALRNNPFAPAPTPAYVDLKTLRHAVAKVL
jgi:hypothetical protein